MIETPASDPLKERSRLSRISMFIFEVPGNILRFFKVLSARREFTNEMGEEFLRIAETLLKESPNQIIQPNDKIEFEGFVAKGLSSACFQFSINNSQKYALKIGSRISHAMAYPAPSTEKFAKFYQYQLNLLINSAKDEGLEYLIPEPQLVLFLGQEGIHSLKDYGPRTIIIQPFYSDIHPATTSLHKFSNSERLDLYSEFKKTERLFKKLESQHGLILDMGQKDNIVLAKCSDGRYHFVMLDNEMKDKNVPAPMLNLANLGLKRIIFLGIENRLKKVLK